jgi:hypothetical protein
MQTDGDEAVGKQHSQELERSMKWLNGLVGLAIGWPRVVRSLSALDMGGPS